MRGPVTTGANPGLSLLQGSATLGFACWLCCFLMGGPEAVVILGTTTVEFDPLLPFWRE